MANKSFLTIIGVLAFVPAFADVATVTPVIEAPWQPFGVPMESSRMFRGAQPRNTPEAQKPVFTPDWTCSFDTQEEFDWFTVIDGNNDREEEQYAIRGVWQWRQDARCAFYNYHYINKKDKVDDWLVTPGTYLKAGRQYVLKYSSTNRSNFYDDKMEVKIGTAPTAEGMGRVLIDEASLKSDWWEDHSVPFTVDADGVYYIGFHLIWSGDASLDYIDNVSVSGVMNAKAPANVGDLRVTPEADGSVKAVIKFTLPTKTVDGGPLSSLSGVKIRDGYFDLADIKDVAPGQEVTYTVENLTEARMYNFNVVAYNDIDEGMVNSKDVYVGLDIPKTPDMVDLREKGDRLTLTCEPFVAEHDGVFFPEDVTFNAYTIVRDQYGNPAVGELVGSAKGVNKIEIMGDTEDGDQHQLALVTNVENSAGASLNYCMTNSVITGTPYEVPFEDKFTGGTSEYFWSNSVVAKGWGNTGVYATYKDGYDPDLGCMIFSAVNKGDFVGLMSGKICLAGTVDPKLSFVLDKLAPTDGTFTVEVMTPDGRLETLDEFSITQLEKNVWTARVYDISKWRKERYICVGLSYQPAVSNSNNQIYLDNFYAGDLVPTDLAVDMTLPRGAERGGKAMVNLRIQNFGAEPANGYKVRIYADDEQVYESEEVPEIAGRGDIMLNFPYTVPLLSNAEYINLKATVEVDGDADADNNGCGGTLMVTEPDLATASNLRAAESGNDIILEWDAAGDLAPKTDNFESYKPWNYIYQSGTPNYNPGDWTLVDVDGGTSMGFIDGYRYGAQNQLVAYTVFNPYNFDGYGRSLFTILNEQMAEPFIPRSGDQYFASVFSADVEYVDGEYVGTVKDADNWAISPELNGKAQTITFWVNNYCGMTSNGQKIDHAETFQVLYSTTDTDIDSFTAIGDDRKADGGKWQKVTVDLPEGTKYFAIRHCSKYDAPSGTPFIFMVDDVTYCVDNKPVSSYNVYRDGSKVATTSAQTTAWTDTDVPEGEHLYQVTVSYEDGTESPAVSVSMEHSGIDSVSDGFVEPVDVYTATGILVRRAATTLEGLPAGVYVAGGRKVIVK